MTEEEKCECTEEPCVEVVCEACEDEYDYFDDEDISYEEMLLMDVIDWAEEEVYYAEKEARKAKKKVKKLKRKLKKQAKKGKKSCKNKAKKVKENANDAALAIFEAFTDPEVQKHASHMAVEGFLMMSAFVRAFPIPNEFREATGFGNMEMFAKLFCEANKSCKCKKKSKKPKTPEMEKIEVE